MIYLEGLYNTIPSCIHRYSNSIKNAVKLILLATL